MTDTTMATDATLAHSSYFADYATQRYTNYLNGASRTALEELRLEYSNLRAAWQLLLDQLQQQCNLQFAIEQLGHLLQPIDWYLTQRSLADEQSAMLAAAMAALQSPFPQQYEDQRVILMARLNIRLAGVALFFG